MPYFNYDAKNRNVMIIGTQKPAQENSAELFPTGSTSKHLARLTNGGFMHVHRKLDEINKEDQKAFDSHLKPNGLLIITGHGTGSKVVKGAYDIVDIDDLERLPPDVPLDIQCQAKDYVTLAMDSGQLNAGDHINVLLHVCYGAKKSEELQKSFAQQLGDAFIKRGISTTIIASETPIGRVDRHGTGQAGDIAGKRFKVRTEKENFRIIETSRERNGKTRQTIEKPNDDFYLTPEGAGFLSDFAAKHEKKSFVEKLFKGKENKINAPAREIEIVTPPKTNTKLQRRNAITNLGKLMKSEARENASADLPPAPSHYESIDDVLLKLAAAKKEEELILKAQIIDTLLANVKANPNNDLSIRKDPAFPDKIIIDIGPIEDTYTLIKINDNYRLKNDADKQTISLETFQNLYGAPPMAAESTSSMLRSFANSNSGKINIPAAEKNNDNDIHIPPKIDLMAEGVKTLQQALGDQFQVSADKENPNQIKIRLPNNTEYACTPVQREAQIKFTDSGGEWNKNEVANYLQEQVSPPRTSFKP